MVKCNPFVKLKGSNVSIWSWCEVGLLRFIDHVCGSMPYSHLNDHLGSDQFNYENKPGPAQVGAISKAQK